MRSAWAAKLAAISERRQTVCGKGAGPAVFAKHDEASGKVFADGQALRAVSGPKRQLKPSIQRRQVSRSPRWPRISRALPNLIRG